MNNTEKTMAERCASCGHENIAGALICEKCFALLIRTDMDQPSTTLMANDLMPFGTRSVEPPPEEHPVRPYRQAPTQPDSVALYVGEAEAPLILQITSQAILGRYTPHSVSQPRVDLTPYGAFDKGVSRMHIILRRTDTGLVAEDMASSNGTWLNSRRLQPYTPTVLRSGDRLKLGQLEIEVFLGTEMQESGKSNAGR